MFAFASENTLGFCAMVVALLSVTAITTKAISAETLVSTSSLTAGAAASAVLGQKAIMGDRKMTWTPTLTPGSGGIRQPPGSLHRRWGSEGHCHDDHDDCCDNCCDNCCDDDCCDHDCCRN